jgi:hypothetical protein
VLRLLRLGAHLEALVVALQDEVDHAADRVGTVDRRGAVAQDLDPVDGVERNRVQVDRGALERVVDDPPAVEENQGLVAVGAGRAAQAAQVGLGLGAGGGADRWLTAEVRLVRRRSAASPARRS